MMLIGSDDGGSGDNLNVMYLLLSNITDHCNSERGVI